MQQPGASPDALTQVPVRHSSHLSGGHQAGHHRGRRHPGGRHVQQKDQGHVGGQPVSLLLLEVHIGDEFSLSAGQNLHWTWDLVGQGFLSLNSRIGQYIQSELFCCSDCKKFANL